MQLLCHHTIKYLILNTQGFKELYDPILAYKFLYPVVTSAGLELQMTLTHPPEKVSQQHTLLLTPLHPLVALTHGSST